MVSMISMKARQQKASKIVRPSVHHDWSEFEQENVKNGMELTERILQLKYKYTENTISK